MEAETLWGKIKTSLRDGAATAAEKAEYLGRMGRAKLDIARTRHAIHDAFTELGGQVYERLGENPDAVVGQEETIGEKIRAIQALETRLQHQETELKTLQVIDQETDADTDTEPHIESDTDETQ